MIRSLYMALGDSVTCGRDATYPMDSGFVPLVFQALQTHAATKEVVVVAKGGWTTGQLLMAAQSVDRQLWQQAKVVTLCIGGNDLRRQYYSSFGHPAPLQIISRSIEGYTLALHQVCELVKSAGVPYVFLATMYNPLPNAPLAVHAITAMNASIHRTAVRFSYPVVDIHSEFEGKQAQLIHRYRTGRLEDMATPFSRPIHPNDAGHHVIAQTFCKHIEKTFAKL